MGVPETPTHSGPRGGNRKKKQVKFFQGFFLENQYIDHSSHKKEIIKSLVCLELLVDASRDEATGSLFFFS